MKARFNFPDAAPDAYKAVIALDRYVKEESGLDRRLIHLIKLRASQINGCAYCVDMHVKEARRDGLSEQWINLIVTIGAINVWNRLCVGFRSQHPIDRVAKAA